MLPDRDGLALNYANDPDEVARKPAGEFLHTKNVDSFWCRVQSYSPFPPTSAQGLFLGVLTQGVIRGGVTHIRHVLIRIVIGADRTGPPLLGGKVLIPAQQPRGG